MNQAYKIVLGGQELRYRFRYPKTVGFFRGELFPAPASEPVIYVDDDWFAKAKALNPEVSDESYLEFRALIGVTARELLAYERSILHSVSFVWRGKAFLLAAPSGTGKTTQYFNWQRLFPGEITMISGDMPVLERREDGTVWAHHSVWNGKEKIGNPIAAPIGGLVLLEQGRENRIAPLSARDAIKPLFQQFIVRPETEEQILALSRLMDALLRSVPCFKFVNRGDEASTILLRETLTSLTEGESHDRL